MKKSKTRIFIGKPISSNLMIYVKDKQHHFLKNVLRAKINDEINVFDGKSGEWNSTIISINRDNTVLRVKKNISKLILSPDIWLVFAPIKQNRMNISIQKATEIGVRKIIPCITEFTNVRSIKIKNLYDNAIEASEQSERLDVPIIEKAMSLNALFQNWPTDRKLVFCDEKTISNHSIIETLKSQKNLNNKWGVIVGPEGGFSESEKKQISEQKNVITVSLGDKVLRSDTAITVSLFCIKELFY